MFRRTPCSKAGLKRARLFLEVLEDRVVPANFLVNTDLDTIADDGLTSLREAILAANTSPGDDIIDFDPTFFATPRTINLTIANDFPGQNDGYTINDSVTINGPGVLTLALNGAGVGNARLITIDSTAPSDNGVPALNGAASITVNINNLTFTGVNSGSAPGGGAILNQGETVNLTATHFENNEVTSFLGRGGAIRSQRGGTLNINQSSFVNNRATGVTAVGGAIYINDSTAFIENSTFTQNVAEGGGAISNQGNTTLRLNTFSNNAATRADMGGAVVNFSPGSINLFGNILFGNRAAGATDDVRIANADGVHPDSGFNDIGVRTGPGAAALQPGVNGNISADPMLGPLTTLANGTRAFTPAEGSPVLDTIPPANASNRDQWNNVRPVNGRSDMGSIERGALPATSITHKIGTFNAGTWLLDRNNDGSNAGEIAIAFGQAGDIPIVGDWDGDGTDDIGVVRVFGNTLQWILDRNGNGIYDNGDFSTFFGQAGDIPVAGDWNQDRVTDMGVVRSPFPGGPLQWILDRNGSGDWDPGDFSSFFGVEGDRPVVGDWDGNSVDDIGVVRPRFPGGPLQWILDRNSSTGYDAADFSTFFGMAGDHPAVGDWNSDSRADMGVVRIPPPPIRGNPPSGNLQWILDRNGDGAYDPGDFSWFFGFWDDIPVTGRWFEV